MLSKMIQKSKGKRPKRKNRDLPVELWLEILVYLPRTTLHKMMGASRNLFELALDDLYREIQFLYDDLPTRKMFENLKFSGPSKRVRHFYIRPFFLPGMDEDLGATDLATKLNSSFTYVKNLTRHRTKELAGPLEDPAYEFLSLAKEAVKACVNLEELTIIVHDLSITPLFMAFLDSLLQSDSIGPRLKKIAIDTTILKLPVIFNPLSQRTRSLSNLEVLDVNIAISRFPSTSSQATTSFQSICSFAEALKGQLADLILSCDNATDLTPLLGNFPKLSRARTLELFCVCNNVTIPNTASLTKLIEKQSETLEELTISHHSRHLTLLSSDDSYTTWLDPSSASQHFHSLRLPHLRSLDLELREFAMWPLPTRSKPVLDLSSITPQLTSLTLDGVALSLDALIEILDHLPKDNGSIILQSFGFWTKKLSANLFDELSKRIQSVRRLRICSESQSSYSGSHHAQQQAKPFNLTMSSRRYPRWPLRELRITKVPKYGCRIPHPCFEDGKSVAQCFSSDLHLDLDMECDCRADVV